MGFMLYTPLTYVECAVLYIDKTLVINNKKNLVEFMGKRINYNDVLELLEKLKKEVKFVPNFVIKINNYSLVVYTLKYGIFFGLFDSVKHFKRNTRVYNFYENFKLGFFVSMFTNFLVYPFDIAREKFCYELVHNKYKKLETLEDGKIQSIFKELKPILKNTFNVFRDHSLVKLGYGIYNRAFLPAFFTGYTIAFYEKLKKN